LFHNAETAINTENGKISIKGNGILGIIEICQIRILWKAVFDGFLLLMQLPKIIFINYKYFRIPI